MISSRDINTTTCVYIYFNRLNYYKNFHPLLELNVEINRERREGDKLIGFLRGEEAD